MKRYVAVMLIGVIMGNLPGVSGAVEKVIAQNDTAFKRNAYLHFIQGLLFEREGRYDDALKEYAETVRIDPGASYVHRSLSTINMMVGNVDASLAAAIRVKELEKDNPDASFLLGSIYLMKGETEKAAASFEECFALDPENKEALLYLAGLSAKNDAGRAAGYLERYLKIDPDAADVHYELGLLYGQSRSKENKALHHLNRAVELSPRLFGGHLAIAQILEQKKKYKESLAAYERCIALKSGNKLLQAHVGLLYLREGNVEKADQIYQDAIRGSAEEPGFLFWLGMLAEEKKDWPKAVEYLVRAIEKEKDTRSLLRLSYYYMQLGKRKKAMKWLTEAKQLDPADTQVRMFLSYGYQEEGNIRKARAELEELVVVAPDLPEAHFQLGILYEQSGMFQKGIPHLYRVLELKAGHAPAANYLGYSFADRDIRLDEAERLVRIALEQEPDNPAYIDSLGWVYYRQGRYADALAELSKAANALGDPIIREHLGDAHWALAVASGGEGAVKNAQRSWAESFKADPSRNILRKKIDRNKTAPAEDQRPHHLLELFAKNQLGIDTLTGFFSIKGRMNGARISLRGTLMYVQPDRIRIDFLGPMMDIWCSLIYAEGKVACIPERTLETSFDGDIAIPEEVVMLMAAYISGAVREALISPEIIIEEGRKVTDFTGSSVKAAFGSKDGMMRYLEYHARTGDRIEARFKNRRNGKELFTPSRIEFCVPGRSLRLIITLDKVMVGADIAPGIFEPGDQ